MTGAGAPGASRRRAGSTALPRVPRLRERARRGLDRARSGAWPVLQASVAAALALLLAQRLLGHPSPFFAAVAAFVCLGLSDERRLRRVVELAVGVTLGVALGDLFVLGFGTGPVQVAVALATAVLVALTVVGGQLAPTQAGVQAVLVVALPPTAGSPLARWQDAFVGSAVAVAVAVLLPGDPRRLPRARLGAVTTELAAVLERVADALREGDAAAAGAALDRARATQPLIDAAQAALTGSREVARIAPLRRRHRDEVARLTRAAGDLDRAVRNARVVARRAVAAVEGGRRLPRLADALVGLAAAARLLRADVVGGGGAWHARGALLEVARGLSPAVLAPSDPHGAAVVALLRPLVVDLLEATGLSHDEARAALPVEPAPVAPGGPRPAG